VLLLALVLVLLALYVLIMLHAPALAPLRAVLLPTQCVRLWFFSAIQAFLAMYRSNKPDASVVDPQLRASNRWRLCALTDAPLRAPVCCDALGTLFNLEALLEALAARTLPPRFAHVERMADIIRLRLDEGAKAGGERQVAVGGGGEVTEEAPLYVCPVSLQAMGDGKSRFAVVRATGHVFSERALKSCRAACEDVCGRLLADAAAELVTLNGTDDEVEALAERLLAAKAARAAAKAAKKAAKAAKKASGGAAAEKKAALDAAKPLTARHVAAPAPKGRALATAGSAIAKRSVAELAPEGATAEVWGSIFKKQKQEDRGSDFLTRSAGL
jgi:hypothetical protein